MREAGKVETFFTWIISLVTLVLKDVSKSLRYVESVTYSTIKSNYQNEVLFFSEQSGTVDLNFVPGEIAWEAHLGTPVVGMYHWQPDGLQKVPSTFVAEETIDSIMNSALNGENGSRFLGKGQELVLK